MAILKYSYLTFGILLYIGINYISYTNPNFTGDMQTKILFSFISLVLLTMDYFSILFTKKLFNKSFSEFTTYVKVSLYLGVVIIPLISLYYS
ncbi:MAG: hypothetical protein NUK62_06090 [Tenericutes bacterium]|jgi:hypothetical protein|nr:hypothetical protein [Mycoplasmatota bacterium]